MELDKVFILFNSMKIEATVGDNLLDVLLSAGADINYGCRSGNCGACSVYEDASDSILRSCQTNLYRSLSLSKHIPITSHFFRVVQVLNKGYIELELLGPSDDAFGDEVYLVPKGMAGTNKIKCLSVNLPGEPLKILLGKSLVPEKAWESILSIAENDVLQVYTQSLLRKGRLLKEMNLFDQSVILVTQPHTDYYSPHWKAILDTFSASFLGKVSLEEETGVEVDHLVSKLTPLIQTKKESRNLKIIFHGYQIPMSTWSQVLAELRLRAEQLCLVSP